MRFVRENPAMRVRVAMQMSGASRRVGVPSSDSAPPPPGATDDVHSGGGPPPTTTVSGAPHSTRAHVLLRCAATSRAHVLLRCAATFSIVAAAVALTRGHLRSPAAAADGTVVRRFAVENPLQRVCTRAPMSPRNHGGMARRHDSVAVHCHRRRHVMTRTAVQHRCRCLLTIIRA